MSKSTLKTESSSKRLVPQQEVLGIISETMARRFQVMPLAFQDNSLQVAMVNPADVIAIEALETICDLRIEPVPANVKQIQEAIDASYKGYHDIEEQVSKLSPILDIEEQILSSPIETDAPIARALNMIIDEAVKARASDVHIQPQEDKVQIRYRIDGVLSHALTLPRLSESPLISRIKILANMNIADHHRPQDGRFSIETKGRLIDIRVGVAPTVFGELAVLRLLDKSRAMLNLTDLGFSADNLECYQSMLASSYGIILVSGPTGSGKTTTLYSSINSMDRQKNNILTVEDPVEYRFRDINQVQVNPKAGITFPSGLRSFLRLDPDVILVGEIRDSETADIAVQAALTGHLVLSSIHANDAVSVIYRLIDLGVEPFLVSTALVGIVAQRMVRQVCQECGEFRPVSSMEQMIYQQETGDDRQEFHHGEGCPACSYSGYWGRRGLFEILPVSDAMRGLILSRADTNRLHEQAALDGMVPLMKDGMRKVTEGLTTPSEVLRTTYNVD